MPASLPPGMHHDLALRVQPYLPVVLQGRVPFMNINAAVVFKALALDSWDESWPLVGSTCSYWLATGHATFHPSRSSGDPDISPVCKTT